MRRQSIILLSGGLDSAANLALAREYDQPVMAITARYGQRAADREVEAARAFCEYYDVRHEIVDLPWLGKLGGSALTAGETRVPVLDRAQLDHVDATRESARAVWVPNRNGVLIHVAAAFADRLRVPRVVVGFNREEAATFPDNTVEYLNRETAALALSTANGVEIFSYTAEWDKRRIVSELRNLARPFPFEKLWSCYEGLAGEHRPCGTCESCQRLARALS